MTPSLASKLRSSFSSTVLVGTLVGPLGAVFLACSSASGGGAPESPADAVSAICSKFVACGTADNTTGTPYTQSSCVSDFTGWVPPSGCADAIDSASCGTINGGAGSSTQAICFPTCPAVGSATCNGNTITLCVGDSDAGATSGTSVVEDCAATCGANGQTYTGVCGASYQGQASASGQDTCWCNGGGDTSVGADAAPSASCQGTPPACAGLGEGECVDGCLWTPTCVGTPQPCSNKPDFEICDAALGCGWNDSDGCTGTALVCDGISPAPYDYCSGQQGCRVSDACEGTHNPCSRQGDETLCAAVPGCSWQ